MYNINARTLCHKGRLFWGPGVQCHSHGDTSFRDEASPHQQMPCPLSLLSKTCHFPLIFSIMKRGTSYAIWPNCKYRRQYTYYCQSTYCSRHEFHMENILYIRDVHYNVFLIHLQTCTYLFEKSLIAHTISGRYFSTQKSFFLLYSVRILLQRSVGVSSLCF